MRNLRYYKIVVARTPHPVCLDDIVLKCNYLTAFNISTSVYRIIGKIHIFYYVALSSFARTF